jgi:hypothetical protein
VIQSQGPTVYKTSGSHSPSRRHSSPPTNKTPRHSNDPSLPSLYSRYTHLSRNFTTLGRSQPTHFHVPHPLKQWRHICEACLATARTPPPCTEKPRPVVAAAPHQLQLPPPSTCRRHRRGPCHRRQPQERHLVRLIARAATTPLLWYHHLSVIRPMILVIPTKIADHPSIGLRATSILIRKVRATSRTLDPYQIIRSSRTVRGTQGASLKFRRVDT